MLAVVLLSGFRHQNYDNQHCLLYSGIRGFHYNKTVRKDQTEYYHMISTATEAVCTCCKSKQSKFVETSERRSVRGLPVGLKKRFSLCRPGGCAARVAMVSPVSVWAFARLRTGFTKRGRFN